MEPIIEAMKNNNYEQLIFIIFSTIFIWLFKEFRTSYLDSKKEGKDDVKCALERYSNLYHAIVLFQSNEIDFKQLSINFHQTIPYLPRDIAIEILEINKASLKISASRLDNIKTKVKNEIISLKVTQYSVTSRNSDDDIFNKGEWFFSKYNFDALISPLLYSAFTFLVMLLILIYGFEIIQSTGYKRINLTLIMFNSFFVLITSIIITDLLIRKLLRKNVLSFYLSLVLAPWILTMFILHHPILNMITLIIFYIITLKKDLLRPYNK